MKINKTLIILSLLLIFCISLGAVSAADNTDMSVNDINDNVATVESSVNVDDEISTVSEGIHYSSEIADNISSTTGIYDITADYQIDKTWEILKDNVIIEGNNHTIYGNGKQAFYITGNNVTIKNLNFVDCSAMGGSAIYFNDNGSVSDCSFVNCNANIGGAISLVRGSVTGCSFVNCSAPNGFGGAILCSESTFINYCIFENNSATYGNIIYIYLGPIDVNFNFFGFQNNVTEFPDDLIYGGVKPTNWVVLDIVNSSDEYVVKFVLNNGFSLNDCMHDYNASLTINGVTEDICIKNNTFSGPLVDGDYLLTSLNKGNTLAEGIHDFNYIDYEIEVIDCEYSEDAIVNINFTSGISGNVTVKVDGGQEITKTITNNSITITISGLSIGIHNLNIYYNGKLFYTSAVTVSPYSKYDMNFSVENITYGQDTIINVTLPTNATSNVTLFINGKKYSRSVNNGKVSFNLAKLGAGSYDFSLNYTGDNNYSSKIVTGSFKVEKYPSKVTVSASDVPYLSDVNVKVTLDAVNPSGKITYYLDGRKYDVKDVTNLSLVIRNLIWGVHSLVVEYSGNSNNTNSSASCNFTVIKNDTYVISVSAKNITVGEVVYVVVTLPNDAIGYVDLYINDKYYGDSGVRSGIAEFNITGLNPNNYTIKAVYSGDYKYNSSENSTNFKITAKTVSITLSSVTEYSVLSGENYTVTFTSGGVPISNARVVFELVNGDIKKNYTVYTDNDGKASLPINLAYTKEYIFNIYFNNTGYEYNVNSQTIIVTVGNATFIDNFTDKTFNSTTMSGDNFTIQLVNDNKGIAGVYVDLDFKKGQNGTIVTYKIKTNSEGNVTLPLNLKYTGDYYLTAKYENISEDYTINILPKVTSNPSDKSAVLTNNYNGEFVTTKSSGAEVVKLTSENVPIESAIITSNNNAKSNVYYINTNNNDKAKLPINLSDVDNYIIKAIFEGNNIYTPSDESITSVVITDAL